MSSNEVEDRTPEAKQVHFQAPYHIVSRVDILSTIFGKSRTDVIIEAMNMWVDDHLSRDESQRLIATAYYEDSIDLETLATLVGPREAKGYRALKLNLEREPMDIAGPEEIADEPYPDSFEARETTSEEQP